MLSVRVYINRREIARADAINCSDLGALSNYACSAHSEPSPVTGEAERLHGFAVEGHKREQSAWALVAKMAARIADLEGTAITPETEGRSDRA